MSINKLAAYLVHLFTASGAIVGLLSIHFIYQGKLIGSLWLMGIAILIDAIDGTFARLINVKRALPNIDGALLDNIIDYFNYVIVPSCFLLKSYLLPQGWHLLTAGLVLLTSCYQFCQVDAKTDDHFFKGFPSYWNIVVIYLFIWQFNSVINLFIILALALLIFIPVKYVYPSRMDYLTQKVQLRLAMLIATLAWGGVTFLLLWMYPKSHFGLIFLSVCYLILYGCVSLYRTFVSLTQIAK
jgi:phosphatidylcholine synthase